MFFYYRGRGCLAWLAKVSRSKCEVVHVLAFWGHKGFFVSRGIYVNVTSAAVFGEPLVISILPKWVFPLDGIDVILIFNLWPSLTSIKKVYALSVAKTSAAVSLLA